eukprot:3423069-Pyramimonas_sp.AAC.1
MCDRSESSCEFTADALEVAAVLEGLAGRGCCVARSNCGMRAVYDSLVGVVLVSERCDEVFAGTGWVSDGGRTGET